MLTYEDCLSQCALTEEEVEAIAEHEHVPTIIAIGLGEKLLHSEQGVRTIHRMIMEDLQRCRSERDAGRRRHLQRLQNAAQHFEQYHPGCRG